MIADLLKHADLYCPLLPQWERCIAFLRSIDPAAPTGRIDLDGDRVFALVQRYLTGAPETKRFESHDRHLDLHCLLAGYETVYSTPTERLTATEPTNREKDYTLYADPVSAHNLQLAPGSFVLLHPHDGHKTGCITNLAMPATKVVIKIRLSD